MPNGLTPQGFQRKRLDEIITDLNASYQSVYGSSFNVSPESKQGQIIANLATEFSSLWEFGEENYNAFNPSAAMDKALSDLVQYNSITRQPATSSTVFLTLTGVAGTIISIGAQVQNSVTNELFENVNAVQIPPGGTLNNIEFKSVNTGPVVGAAGTLTIIFTPITGWNTATNPLDATLGLNLESDEELRIRRALSTAINAINIVDAVAAQLLALDDVTNVKVLDNDTDLIDANGVPPHSGEAIVQGGDDDEIAQVLLNNKIPGIPWTGTTNVPTNDSQGFPRDINFTRPTDIIIIVQVDLSITTDFPVGGEDQIKQNIVDYANGLLIPGRGFSVGDDVIRTELFTPVNFVPGHTVTQLLIAIFGDPLATANIPIAIREASSFDVANIVVNT